MLEDMKLRELKRQALNEQRALEELQAMTPFRARSYSPPMGECQVALGPCTALRRRRNKTPPPHADGRHCACLGY